MLSPTIPYDAARTEMSVTAVVLDAAVNCAYLLFSHTNTTGRSCTPAKFNASWNVPLFAAPSPKKHTATSLRC